MQKTKWIAGLATMVVLASPAAAQWPSRLPSGGSSGSTGSWPARTTSRTESRRTSDRIPPGHMPPPGMCRVWIDGVPPGRQPAPTDCATAYRTRPANARVIYGGDGSSFPGKGKGKWKHKRNGDDRYDRSRRGDDDRYDRRGRDDDDDDDRYERGGSRQGTAGSWPVRTQDRVPQQQTQKGKKGRPWPN